MQLRAQHKFFLAGIFLANLILAPGARAEFQGGMAQGGQSSIGQGAAAAGIIAGTAGAIGAAAIMAGSQEDITAMNNANYQQTLTKTLANNLDQQKENSLLALLRLKLGDRIDERQTASDLAKFSAAQALNMNIVLSQADMQSQQRAADYSMKNLMFDFNQAIETKQRKIQELVAQLTATAASGVNTAPVVDVDSSTRLPVRSIASSNTLLNSANNNLGQGFTQSHPMTSSNLAFNPIAGGSTVRAMHHGSALAQFQQSVQVRKQDEGIPHRTMNPVQTISSSTSDLATHGGSTFSDTN